MVDIAAAIGVVATLTLALTIALQSIRATHYAGQLEELHQKISEWLVDVEDELERELKKHPSVERVVEIASKFSSVKSKQKRVEELQAENAKSVQSSIVVSIGVILAALGGLYALENTAVQFLIALVGLVWSLNIYNVHHFLGEYNELESKARTRKM